MSRQDKFLLALAVPAGLMVSAVHAQAPPPPPVPDGPRYVVTYVEVMPTAKANAASACPKMNTRP